LPDLHCEDGAEPRLSLRNAFIGPGRLRQWVSLDDGFDFPVRHEIKRYYKEQEGWDIEIRPFFTFFFSVLYINYCLNPVTFKERGATTTLNLRK